MTGPGSSVVDRTRLTSLLEGLARADSTNPPGGEAAVTALLVAHLRACGFSPEVYEVLPDRPNLSVSVGSGSGPVLLFNAHTDTMPAGNGWSHPPFSALIEDGWLYGRGACDAKGGLAAMVEAMIVLAAEGPRLRGTVVLDAVIDEEAGASGTKATIDRGRHADWAIVAEPSDLGVARLSNGQLDVAVTLRGRAAHGSTPDDGLSAITAAADLIAAIERDHERLRHDAHPLLGAASYNVGTISGGLQASIVASACRLEIDRRILPGSSLDQAIADVDRLLDGLTARRPGIEVAREVTVAIPPVEVPESSSVCRALLDGLRGVGHTPLIVGLRASSDAAWLDGAGIPTVVFGPGSITDAHRPDERVALDDVVVAAEVLARAALDLVG